jgi:hypothetical protein
MTAILTAINLFVYIYNLVYLVLTIPQNLKSQFIGTLTVKASTPGESRGCLIFTSSRIQRGATVETAAPWY